MRRDCPVRQTRIGYALTAAIRTARLHTGRMKGLHSGYHGWHDWYVDTLQPKLKDPSQPSTLFRFQLNDAASFGTLVEAHRWRDRRGDPGAGRPGGTLDDPPCHADPVFLRYVADVCRELGCVLIFDEIVTGFRHPHGSVQQATGVIPASGLSREGPCGGMPLSALVGRRDIMKTSLDAAYMPTFRGEVYSLAAAEAALQIHQRQDVPGNINDLGSRSKTPSTSSVAS